MSPRGPTNDVAGTAHFGSTYPRLCFLGIFFTVDMADEIFFSRGTNIIVLPLL